MRYINPRFTYLFISVFSIQNLNVRPNLIWSRH